MARNHECPTHGYWPVYLNGAFEKVEPVKKD